MSDTSLMMSFFPTEWPGKQQVKKNREDLKNAQRVVRKRLSPFHLSPAQQKRR